MTNTYPSSRSAWYCIAFLGALYCISHADRMALSLLVPPIQAELGISDVQFGLLIGTSFASVYVVFGMILAPIADKANRKWLIVFGGLVWTISTTASAYAENFDQLVVTRLGIAVGEAALTPAAISMIGDMFPAERRAAPTSFYTGSGIIGATGSFAVLAAIYHSLSTFPVRLPFTNLDASWRTSLFCIGVIGTVLVAIFAATVREPKRHRHLPNSPADEVGGKAPWRALGYLMAAYGSYAYVSLGIFAWYSTILVRDYGLSVASAGSFFGVIGAISMASGAFSVPWLLSLFKSRPGMDGPSLLFAMALAILMPTVFLALNANTLFLALIALSIAMFMLGVISVLPYLLLQMFAPPHLRARGSAVLVLIASVVGMGLGPVSISLLAKLPMFGSLAKALTWGAILSIFLSILFVLLARRIASNTIQRPS